MQIDMQFSDAQTAIPNGITSARTEAGATDLANHDSSIARGIGYGFAIEATLFVLGWALFHFLKS